jgi:hypothetical protein
MKKIAVLALATLAAAGAFAQSAPAGGLTREQVQQEYLAARAAGTLPQPGELYSGIPAAGPSTVSRAAVERDLQAARAQGTLVPAGENEFGSSTDVVGAATTSRAQIQADAARVSHLPSSQYLGG